MHKRLAQLWPAMAGSVVAVVLCAMAGAMVVGPAGVLGALAGGGLVVTSYTLSSVVLAWLDLRNRRMILPVGLALYVAKIVVLGAFLSVMLGAGWEGNRTMAVSVGVSVVVWVATQLVWVYRSRIPYVDLTES